MRKIAGKMAIQQNGNMVARPDDQPTLFNLKSVLKNVTVRVPEELYQKVKIRAATNGTTVQEIVGAALRKYLEAREGGDGE